MKKNFLDKIEVKSPCNESWDEMIGNDEVRFCSHCAKNVYNISAMNRVEAEKLVKKSNGKLCVRYTKTPTGKMITAPPKLTQITRRATIAASVLATSLALSTPAYAQSEPLLPKNNSQQTQKDKANKSEIKQASLTISGTIKDQQGAVIPRARIYLYQTITKKNYTTQSNSEGIYEFKNVESAIYQIEIEANGFQKFVLKKFEVGKDAIFSQDFFLKTSGEVVGFLVVNEERVEMQETKPIQIVIQQRPLIDLPPNPNPKASLGLVILPKEEKSQKKKKKN